MWRNGLVGRIAAVEEPSEGTSCSSHSEREREQPRMSCEERMSYSRSEQGEL